MSETQDLYEKAKRLIPGRVQLLSKRPELFLPDHWPAYYRRAAGVEIEDLDGRTYTDVGIHAVGSCPLGYADPDVEAAVVAVIAQGSMASLNAPEEIELAERLCALHPWAEAVRYGRGGGEAMAIAARIARAATGRSKIAFCGYHGWHDWYLAANLSNQSALDDHLLPDIDPLGVPVHLEGSAIPFPSGDFEAVDRLATDHGEALAAIVLEPARYALPPPGYLEHVAAVAARIGAVLIFDEITSGFRMAVGGLHLQLGVSPDIAVFAKAMSNGYPMAAVIGRRSVMEAAGRSFISSTYWTERIGPTAALATIAKLEAQRVPEHLCAMGQRMREGWEQLARTHGLDATTKGIPPLPSFSIQAGDATKAVATLYTQCMLEAGHLAAGGFYPSLAHTPEIVDTALECSAGAFAQIRAALEAGDVTSRLKGPVAHAGLREMKR